MLEIKSNQHPNTLNKRIDQLHHHHFITPHSLLIKRQITVISPTTNPNNPPTTNPNSATTNSPITDADTLSNNPASTSTNTPSTNPTTTTNPTSTTTPTTTTSTTNSGNTNSGTTTKPTTTTNDVNTDKSTTNTNNNDNNNAGTTTSKNPTDKSSSTTPDTTNSTPILSLPTVGNSTQSALPAVASQATSKASDTNKTVTPVGQTPTNVSFLHPSLATPSPASVVTQTNQAGVVVTQTLYAPRPAATLSAGTHSAASHPSSASNDDETGTSVGTIMGIVVGALIGAVILAGFIGMFLKKKKARMMSDFDDNPFLNDKYGNEGDYNNNEINQIEGTHGLNRTNTDRSRPRPPSILERHFGAPSLPAQSFQPGQIVNYSPPVPSSNQFPPHPPNLNPQFTNYPPQQGQGQGQGGYGASEVGYGHEVGNGGYGNEVGNGGYGNEVVNGGYGNAVAQGYNTHYNNSPPSRTVYPNEAMIYQHQQSQDPKQGNLIREVSGKLKNPYEGVEEYPIQEEMRSGTPTQPNLQQSYFTVSHPDSLASGGTQSPVPVLPTNPNLSHHNTVNKHDRDQRTLSVMNGESQFNDFHGF